jgi:hypothetical protein
MPREATSYTMSHHYSVLGLDRYVLTVFHDNEHSYIFASCMWQWPSLLWTTVILGPLITCSICGSQEALLHHLHLNVINAIFLTFVPFHCTCLKKRYHPAL